MGRSGYDDSIDDVLALGRWRAAVKSALRGKRGQAFLKEALAVLDAMPDKRLVANDLIFDGWQPPSDWGDEYWLNDRVIVGGDELVDARGIITPMGSVCLLGAVGRARGMDLSKLDPDDIETVAPAFGIADAMVREIVYWNDEGGYPGETPERRWARMRRTIESWITKGPSTEATGS